jgi:hypothetical protein
MEQERLDFDSGRCLVFLLTRQKTLYKIELANTTISRKNELECRNLLSLR